MVEGEYQVTVTKLDVESIKSTLVASQRPAAEEIRVARVVAALGDGIRAPGKIDTLFSSVIDE